MLDTVSRAMHTEQYTQKQKVTMELFKNFQDKQTCFWKKKNIQYVFDD